MLRVQTYKGFIIKKTAFIKRNGAYIKLSLLLPLSYPVLKRFVKNFILKNTLFVSKVYRSLRQINKKSRMAQRRSYQVIRWLVSYLQLISLFLTLFSQYCKILAFIRLFRPKFQKSNLNPTQYLLSEAPTTYKKLS